jgi:hypothetical protein
MAIVERLGVHSLRSKAAPAGKRVRLWNMLPRRVRERIRAKLR